MKITDGDSDVIAVGIAILNNANDLDVTFDGADVYKNDDEDDTYNTLNIDAKL